MRTWMGAAAAVLAAGTAMAEEALPGLEAAKVAPQGQVILNPEPDYSAPPTAQPALDELATLAPEAGPAPSDCPQADGWQVVVIRGNEAPTVVSGGGGHMITVMPPGC